MLTVLKLLLSGTDLAGNIRAKYQAARRSAMLIAVFAVAGIVLMLIGVSAMAMAIYPGLAPVVSDYQAAPLLAAALVFGAAVSGMAAVRKIRMVANAQHGIGHRPDGRLQASGLDRQSTDQPMLGSLTRSVQSPAVIAALVIGVLVGRRPMKNPMTGGTAADGRRSP